MSKNITKYDIGTFLNSISKNKLGIQSNNQQTKLHEK